jgi:hypothetical protein
LNGAPASAGAWLDCRRLKAGAWAVRLFDNQRLSEPQMLQDNPTAYFLFNLETT